jgi:hypothetical protein
LVAGVARADEPPPVPVTKVELKERPELAKQGKIALYDGEADDKGVAFYIDGLGINTPVIVMLASGDAASPMKLSLKNDLSMDWDRHVKAEAGISTAKFRTEGPATALVQSPTAERKPYHLMIWVGPEVKVHTMMQGPFVSQADYDKQHPGGAASGGTGGGGSGATIGIAVAVGIVVLGLIFVVARRKKAGAR